MQCYMRGQNSSLEQVMIYVLRDCRTRPSPMLVTPSCCYFDNRYGGLPLCASGAVANECGIMAVVGALSTPIGPWSPWFLCLCIQ